MLGRCDGRVVLVVFEKSMRRLGVAMERRVETRKVVSLNQEKRHFQLSHSMKLPELAEVTYIGDLKVSSTLWHLSVLSLIFSISKSLNFSGSQHLHDISLQRMGASLLQRRSSTTSPVAAGTGYEAGIV